MPLDEWRRCCKPLQCGWVVRGREYIKHYDRNPTSITATMAGLFKQVYGQSLDRLVWPGNAR